LISRRGSSRDRSALSSLIDQWRHGSCPVSSRRQLARSHFTTSRAQQMPVGSQSILQTQFFGAQPPHSRRGPT